MVGRFSIGDDARDECRIIADQLNRQPGSIDRQWRNIAALIKGDTELHIGQLVRRVLLVHLSDPQAGNRLALAIARANGWNLETLVRAGALDTSMGQVTTDEANRLRRAVVSKIESLDYCIFPTGTHGYSLDQVVRLDDGLRFRCYISCALTNGAVPGSPVCASKASVRSAVRKRLEESPVKRLPSGSITMYVYKRLLVGAEQLALSIRVSEIRAEETT